MFGASPAPLFAGLLGIIVVVVVISTLLGSNVGQSEWLQPSESGAGARRTDAETTLMIARGEFELEQDKREATRREEKHALSQRLLEEQIVPTFCFVLVLLGASGSLCLLLRGALPYVNRRRADVSKAARPSSSLPQPAPAANTDPIRSPATPAPAGKAPSPAGASPVVRPSRDGQIGILQLPTRHVRANGNGNGAHTYPHEVPRRAH